MNNPQDEGEKDSQTETNADQSSIGLMLEKLLRFDRKNPLYTRYRKTVVDCLKTCGYTFIKKVPNGLPTPQKVGQSIYTHLSGELGKELPLFTGKTVRIVRIYNQAKKLGESEFMAGPLKIVS